MTVILTYPSAIIPRSLLLFGWSYQIKQYIPRPLQCKKCWRLNHSQQRCRQEPACPICHLRHEGMGHKATGHGSADRSCPQYLKKQEIIQIAINRKISFVEAAAYMSQNTERNGDQRKKHVNHSGFGDESGTIPALEAKIRELTKRVEELETRQQATDETLKSVGAKMVTPQALEDQLKKVEDRMIDKLDIILNKLNQGSSTKRPSVSPNGPGKRRPNLVSNATAKPSAPNSDVADMDLGNLASLPNDWIDPNTIIDDE